jgi:glutathione S-transferase
LTINSRNYGSWSLRGWLLCRMAGLDFAEEILPAGDPAARAELLLLSPSFLVPRLEHAGVTVWDCLAIAEYLQERFPDASLLPDEPVARALPVDQLRGARRVRQPALGPADERDGPPSRLPRVLRREV